MEHLNDLILHFVECNKKAAVLITYIGPFSENNINF